MALGSAVGRTLRAKLVLGGRWPLLRSPCAGQSRLLLVFPGGCCFPQTDLLHLGSIHPLLEAQGRSSWQGRQL